MTYNQVVISSGHGKYVRGASGYIDEVDEARKVVEGVADVLRSQGVTVMTFHDDTSRTQSENLNRIVSFHNAQQRQLDISVHFNAYQTTPAPRGTECLYVTQQDLSARMASAMAEAATFINRGPKKRTDLYFLNNTAMPAILLEVCFVDSQTDALLYQENFKAICEAISETLTGIPVQPPTEPPVKPPVEVWRPPIVVSIAIETPDGVEVSISVNGELRGA